MASNILWFYCFATLGSLDKPACCLLRNEVPVQCQSHLRYCCSESSLHKTSHSSSYAQIWHKCFTTTKAAKQNQQWTTQREEGCLWKDRKQCGWFTLNTDHPYGIAIDDTAITLPHMYIICHNTSGAAAYTLRAAAVHHSVHPLSPEQKQTLHIINYGPLHSDSLQ